MSQTRIGPSCELARRLEALAGGHGLRREPHPRVGVLLFSLRGRRFHIQKLLPPSSPVCRLGPELVGWLTCWDVDWFIGWLIEWLISFFFCGWFDWLIERWGLTGWPLLVDLIGWLIDWLNDWLVKLIDWLVDWRGCWFDWLIDWIMMIGWLIGVVVWLVWSGSLRFFRPLLGRKITKNNNKTDECRIAPKATNPRTKFENKINGGKTFFSVKCSVIFSMGWVGLGLWHSTVQVLILSVFLYPTAKQRKLVQYIANTLLNIGWLTSGVDVLVGWLVRWLAWPIWLVLVAGRLGLFACWRLIGWLGGWLVCWLVRWLIDQQVG